ncbi:MAG: FGGY family carbohydrate kinase [Cytophagales bacterium]|nr:FGGY family carbohydrate kinase [Bernardetiaceae bacterium]MDW8203992.1 FGGY family carbohydrate kinase [Cytophagales bacterium]
MFTIGYDVGSSSIKAVLFDVLAGIPVASVTVPDTEMPIDAPQPGWAEQSPLMWWEYVQQATRKLLAQAPQVPPQAIRGIGIAYQMHGLVLTDENAYPLRSAIIWCDSRAVAIGERAFAALGTQACLQRLLNSPGNFTASKLRWVIEHEPSIYERAYRMMLPGDFIAFRMTGKATTTASGLSEGALWDFQNNEPSEQLITYYHIRRELIPELVPTLGWQGALTAEAANLLGLAPNTPVTYRAGDQPNNAFALRVLNPGEIAATAGTSGVVYGVSETATPDPQMRFNTFLHVNHQPAQPRLGALLCVNGTGSLNAWLRRNLCPELSYTAMNELAASVPVGAQGVRIYPFGNGAERMLGNCNVGARIKGLQFSTHTRAHVLRAAQEGIVFALWYGMKAMQQAGIQLATIRAGHANMFLSPLFGQTLADLSGATIELYNTDGAQGAARGAAIGAGLVSLEEAFSQLQCICRIVPNTERQSQLQQIYAEWEEVIWEN